MGLADRISVTASFADVDNDADERNPHDYDFSFTGVGTAPVGNVERERLRLRNAVTEPVVPCRAARRVATASAWEAVMLTWVEDGWNYGDGDVEKRERWEGVINRAAEGFPQVGGPSRKWNRRIEIDRDNSGHMSLYYSEVDKRVHLLGAESGLMEVDFDADGVMDVELRYEDTDGNGFFDRS